MHDVTRALLPVLPTAMPETRAVLSPIDRPGTTLELDGREAAPTLVGSGPACAIRLADATVSRRHCELDLVEAGVRVRDLGSRNGTFVDGVRVEVAYAGHGARIRIGAVELAVALAAHVGEELPDDDHFGGFIGASTEIRKIYPLLTRLAAASLPTLIEGETGTGKEVVAEALHRAGPRANRPFVVLDCTTISPALAESELFGHERGAFTGAVARKRGAFELADGGTLFLDEIGDLDLPLQAKLLRLLDRGEFRRLGSEKARRADVRVIAATRRDLDRAVVERTFRDDLYHRLVSARGVLPPLRARRGDVPVLIDYFLRAAGRSPDAIPYAPRAAWYAHVWPGNVRELRLAVERFLALGAEETVAAAGSAPLGSGLSLVDALFAENVPLPEARKRASEAFERRYVALALARAGGNVSKAARETGIARRHFQMLKARSKNELKIAT